MPVVPASTEWMTRGAPAGPRQAGLDRACVRDAGIGLQNGYLANWIAATRTAAVFSIA